MTWTYTNSPATVPRDEVRFLVGDTDTTDQLVSDEEIAYALGQDTNARYAAVRVANALIAKFARLVDKSVGDLSIKYSSRVDHYKELVAQLRQDAVIFGTQAYAGGISVSDKATNSEDTDNVSPFFRRRQMDDNQTTQEPDTNESAGDLIR